MPFETELGNFVIPTDAISAGIAPNFVAASVGLGLVYSEPLPENTNVLKFRKAGKVTAAALAESTAQTYSADHELTDSSVSATATKKAIGTKHSVESLRFGTVEALPARAESEHGMALARLFDSELKTLFSSLSQTVTATSVLTKDDLLDARYQVVAGAKGASTGRLVSMVDYKGANELTKELTDTAGAAFVSQVNLGSIGVPQANGYAGQLMGVEIYQTDGLPTDSGDDVGAVWDAGLCFAAAIDGGGFETTVDIATASNGFLVELSSYGFWHIVEWNDAAGCALKSNT